MSPEIVPVVVYYNVTRVICQSVKEYHGRIKAVVPVLEALDRYFESDGKIPKDLKEKIFKNVQEIIKDEEYTGDKDRGGF